MSAPAKSVDPALVRRIAAEHGTPCYVYFADVIRDRLRSLRAFDAIRYAQKASSNVHLLRLVRAEGALVDAVSLGEIQRALRAGYTGRGEIADLVFTADVIDEPTLDCVLQHDLEVNCGSEDMLTQVGERRRGHRVWLRVNPGFGHGHSHKTNTGGDRSKHGIWHAHVAEALARIDRYDLELVGLHMHIGSGADFDHLKSLGAAMVRQVRRAGRDVRAISAGGGLPIPYRAGDTPIDVDAYFRVWDAARREIEAELGHAVAMEVEPGRYVVGEAGLLVAEVRATKEMGANHFVLVDAGFDNLVRPAMYGSYHEISVVGTDGPAPGPRRATFVGGPLCESGDVFTQEEGGTVVSRDLPEARPGDLVVFHDAGAYGASMSSNYNTRTLAPEVLVDGGTPRLIRRRQTVEELLALENV